MDRFSYGAVLAALLLFGSVARAQPDPSRAALAGTLTIPERFSGEPLAADFRVGSAHETGATDARGLKCPGFVDAAPAVSLTALSGQSFHLVVRSADDTVLLVRTPSGAWLCNDDDDGLNAGLQVSNTESGRYTVWVGLVDKSTERIAATLYVLPPGGVSLDADTLPEVTVALTSSFEPDPLVLEVPAGGPFSTGMDRCPGFVTQMATAAVELSAEEPLSLYVYARSRDEEDLTLAVRTPEGDVVCNDDADALDPGLLVEGASTGRYLVWVGSFSAHARTEEQPRADLLFSEIEGPTASSSSGEPAPEAYEGGEDISLFAAAAHGTLALTPGFSAREVAVVAGGPDAMSVSGPDCAGTIDRDQPDVNVLFGEGGRRLSFAVESGDDTTLLINLPNGRWLCSDDEERQNPALSLEEPEEGLYNVWVGPVRRGRCRGRCDAAHYRITRHYRLTRLGGFYSAK